MRDRVGLGAALGLLRVPGQGTEAGAEAEAVDAELEGGAAAVKEMLEKRPEAEGAGDVLIDFTELAGGEFSPTGAYWGVIAEAVQEELDFAEGEAHVGGETDQEYAREGVTGIAALATQALGRGEEAAVFVVTDSGSVEAGAARELADFHGFSLS